MNELKKGYRITVFIGIAMILSLFIYAVLVEILKANFNPFKGFSPTTGIEILRYLFFGIAIVEFFLIRFIRNRILFGKGAPVKTSAAQGSFSPKISKLMSATMVTYAFCESVAIFGLVMFLIGGSSLDFYTFMVISLFFYAIYFPRYNQWKEWMQAVKSPRPPLF